MLANKSNYLVTLMIYDVTSDCCQLVKTLVTIMAAQQKIMACMNNTKITVKLTFKYEKLNLMCYRIYCFFYH